MRNLAANTPGLSLEHLEATREWMKAVLPEAVVADCGPLIAYLTLPDPDDRHVLAAAIAGKAFVIVTWNLKDFPAKNLLAHGVTSKSPDDFLTGLHAAFPEALISALRLRGIICANNPIGRGVRRRASSRRVEELLRSASPEHIDMAEDRLVD